MIRRLLSVFLPVMFVTSCSIVAAEIRTEDQKVVASDSSQGDYFGWPVSVSDDTAVIGAFRADVDEFPYAGCAYVFTRTVDGWSQQQKLFAYDATTYEQFGRSVAVSGDLVVAGTPLDEIDGVERVGSAYVFIRDGETWSTDQKLLASDGGYCDYFGQSVAIDGNTAVIGAPEHGLEGPYWSDAGSAYVFVRTASGWVEQQELTASDPEQSARFGDSVSVSGDTALVGAWHHGWGYGSAYVFVRQGGSWTQQQILSPWESEPARLCGWSVAINGDTAVLGCLISSTAYVYTRLGERWTLDGKLALNDAGPTDFGFSVSVNGHSAVVGAPLEAYYGRGSGAAHLFQRQDAGWVEVAKLVASDAAPFDGFGRSVSMDAGSLWVGAEGEGDWLNGAAYVFEMEPVEVALKADAGPDQTVELDSTDGAHALLDGSASYGGSGAPLTFEWTWGDSQHASGMEPSVILPVGTTVITLTVSDGESTATDQVRIDVVDTTPPDVYVIFPTADLAVQDGVTLRARASDFSGVTQLAFCLSEAGTGAPPTDCEDLPATFNSQTNAWEYLLETRTVPDGHYVQLRPLCPGGGHVWE